jgi:VWFA-related protein
MTVAHMRWLILLLPIFLFSAAIGIAIPVQSPSQAEQTAEEDFTVKVNVNLVATDVTVIGDHRGALRAEDFVLYDNDRPQKLTYFSQNELPLAIAILFDSSDSVAENRPMLQFAALSSLRRLNPDDQVALFTFTGEYKLNCELTENKRVIAKEIGKPMTGNGTNIYDTLFNAVEYLKKNAPRRRRAIILISDNCHNTAIERSVVKQRSAALLEGAVTLYDLRTDSFDSYGSSCKEPNAAITRMTEETGGEVFKVGSPAALKEAWGRAVSRLREQYTLGFAPAYHGPKGSFHKLTVKFASDKRCPDCKIITRSGYYSGTAAPALDPPKSPQSAPQISGNEDDALIEEILITAAVNSGYAHSIQFDAATTDESDPGGKRQIKLDVNIPADNVQFETKDNQRSCKLRIALVFADKDNQILRAGAKKLRLTMNEAEYERAVKSGIPYSVLIPWNPAYALLKLVAYDEANDQLGSKLITLPSDKK